MMHFSEKRDFIRCRLADLAFSLRRGIIPLISPEDVAGRWSLQKGLLSTKGAGVNDGRWSHLAPAPLCGAAPAFRAPRGFTQRGARRGNLACMGVSDGQLRVHPVRTHSIPAITHYYCNNTTFLFKVSQVLSLTLDEGFVGRKVWLKSRMFKKKKQIHLHV